MTPLKLKLAGFAGVRSGFGRDAIELDLSQLPADRQLIAIVGPNGAGKSTLMDSLHPYRLMPSRASGYAPSSFSFWDHIGAPEALRELVWEHAGAVYRSSLMFKSTGKTKKSECYLHRLESADSWTPVVIEDGTVSDGKTDTYDRCVEAILGKPETFFTSAFAAQSRRPLSDYTNGEIKSLLADLLGIERIRKLGAKAGQVVKLLRSALDGMRSALEQLSEGEAALPGARAAVLQAGARLADAQAGRAVQTQRLADAQAALTAARAAQVQAEQIRRQAAALRERGEREAAQFDAQLRQLSDDVERARRQRAEFAADIEAARADEDRQVRPLKQRSEALQSLIQSRAKIEEAAGKVTAGRARLSEIETQRDAVEARRQARDVAVTRRSQSAAELEGCKRDGLGVKALVDGLKARSALIDQVPCQGSDLQPRCKLLADAIRARDEIGPTEAKLLTLRERHAALKKGVDELDAEIARLGNPAEEVAALNAEAVRIRRDLAEMELLAAKVPLLNDAEASVEAFKVQMEALQHSSAQRQQRSAEAAKAAETAVNDLLARLAQVTRDKAAAQAALAAEMAQLPEVASDTAVAAAEASLKVVTTQLDAAELAVVQATQAVASSQASVAALEAQIATGAQVRTRATRIEDEIARWLILAKAFSNDGIVALSIDDAGPTLQKLVNDLLLSCYGPRFSVSIQTQTQTAKGELREGFDILVHDAERNESKSVTVMSGGERVWINEALTRGIALYLARNSGQQYGTLFCDEADGPLDPKKKRQFIEMKREVLRLGGYQREFFVSQTPELWEMADMVIDVTKL